ncbi:hypothetical protein LguiA_033862 [Lonicera macranthoides]
MSCSTSSVVAAAGEGYRPPFTAVQWQELEHQALIYKYLVAGLPVPPDLVVPIRRSLEALSARFFHHPNLGYCSYYGKKFDPEPGRCRRTDGKKWRCSKDAFPDSKYCERHMHRGRNRSRKPVESQSTSTSAQPVSTTLSHIATGGSSGGSLGSFQSSASASYQNLPLYSIVNNSEGLCFGSNASKLQMENVPCGIYNKEYRYIDEPNFSLGASGSMRGFGTDSNTDTSWPLMASQVHSSSMLKPRNDSHLQANSSPQFLQIPQAFDPMADATTISKQQRQQHCLFGSEIGSPKRVKQEQTHSMRSFFDEWPKALEVDRSSNKSAFSSTQLSMSIPMAPSDYSPRDACSPDDA